MSKPTLTAIIAAALAAGTIYAVQEPDAECSPGEPFMVVVDARTEDTCTRVPVVTVCGEPLTLAWTIDAEASSIDCGDLAEGEVRRVDTATAYPDSIVGYVARHEQTFEDVTIPAVEPHWGACDGAGCYCAGTPDQCEHLPRGGPRGYHCLRLQRLAPEGTSCDS